VPKSTWRFAQILNKHNRVGRGRLTTYMGSIQYFVGLKIEVILFIYFMVVCFSSLQNANSLTDKICEW